MAENQPQIIDLSKLGLEQLTSLKNQLDQVITIGDDYAKELLFGLFKTFFDQWERGIIKNKLTLEVNFFSESLQQLKLAQGKFTESGECIEKLNIDTSGRDLLVPLTSCMYAPGRIKEVTNFILDVGTGYYVEKNRTDSIKYFDRKVKFVTEQMEKIQKIAGEKTRLREVVMDMMEVKVSQQISAMKQQQGAQAVKA